MVDQHAEKADGRGVMGKLLREARLQAGLPQRELSRRTGVTQALISEYESGKKEPSYPQVVRLLASMDMVAEVHWRSKSQDTAPKAVAAGVKPMMWRPDPNAGPKSDNAAGE